MIISVASAIENSGVTTTAWEIARFYASRLKQSQKKREDISLYNRAYYLELDPVGGTVGAALGAPEKARNGMSLVLDNPDKYLRSLEENMWNPEESMKGVFFALLSKETQGVGGYFREGKEEEVAAFMVSGIDNAMVVADMGRVLSNRPMVREADIAIWVVNQNHHACFHRTDRALKSAKRTNKNNFWIATGDIDYDPEVISDEWEDCNFIGMLPHPGVPFGKKPSKKYRDALSIIIKEIEKKSK